MAKQTNKNLERQNEERLVDEQHPWLGLTSFTEATYQYFFGRDEEIQNLFMRVRDNPLSILYGQSGLGKTSLIGAGLIPKLDVANYRARLIRLRFGNDDPSLLQQLKGVFTELLQSDGEAFSEEPTLWEALQRQDLREVLLAKPPVIIFDQFEEVFTLGDQDQREGEVLELMQQIADVVENSPPDSLKEKLRNDRKLAREFDFTQSPVRFLITQREDYLSHLEEYSKVIPSMMRNRMALHKLTGPQALEAVVRPGRMSGQSLISDEVGAQIVRFVAKKSNDVPLEEIQAVPPLVSLVCDELNNLRIEQNLPEITEALVTQQSDDILNAFYETSFAGSPDALRHLVEDRMLTQNGNRYPVPRSDAIHFLNSNGVSDPEACLRKLVNRRLIHTEERGGIQWLEITHDVLAPLAVVSRDERKERERATKAEKAAAESRKGRRKLAMVALAMGILALISIGGMIWATLQTRQATLQTRQAAIAQQQTAIALRKAKIAQLQSKENEEAANKAKRISESQLADTYTQKGIQAFEKWDMSSALLYLVSAGAIEDRPIIRRTLQKTVSRLNSKQDSWAAHTSEIIQITNSSTGKYIATVDLEGTVRLWGSENFDLEYTLSEQGAEPTVLLFDASDESCFIGTATGEVWHYRLKGDREFDAVDLRDHFDRINSLALDEGVLAVASNDRFVTTWNVAEKSQQTKREHNHPVMAAFWLGDGELASISKQGQLMIGAPDDQETTAELELELAAAHFVSRKQILLLSVDGKAQIVDTNGEVLSQAATNERNISVSLSRWDSSANSAVFSDQNGQVYHVKVQSNSPGNTNESGVEPTSLTIESVPVGLQEANRKVTGLAVTDSGDIQVAFESGRMVAWSPQEQSIQFQLESTEQLTAIGPLAGKIVTGNEAGNISVYTPQPQWPFNNTVLGEDVRLDEMAVSTDQKFAAIAATKGKVFLVRLDDMEVKELTHAESPDHWVNSVLFTSDGKQLLSSDHRTIAIWDTATGKQIKNYTPDLSGLSKLKTETEEYKIPPLIKDIAWSELDKALYVMHRTGEIYIPEGASKRRSATTAWHEIDPFNETVIRMAPEFKYGNGHRLVSAPGNALMGIKQFNAVRFVRTNSGDFSGYLSATAVDTSKHRSLMAFGGSDGDINLTYTGSGFAASWNATTRPIDYLRILEIESDRELVFSSDRTGEGKLWGFDGKLLTTFQSPDQNSRATAVDVTNDGGLILVGRDNGTIDFFQTESGRLLASITPHQDMVRSLSVTQDRFYSIGWDGRLVWGELSGVSPASEIVQEALATHISDFETLSSDQRKAWSNILERSSSDLQYQLVLQTSTTEETPVSLAASFVENLGEFSVERNELEFSMLRSRLMGVKQLTLTDHHDESRIILSSDEKTIFSYAEDGTVAIWKIQDQQLEPVSQFNLGYAGWDAELSPNGKLVVMRGFNSELALFSMESGERLPSLIGHEGRNGDLNWERDSNRLISGSRDQTARIWMAEEGTEKQVLRGHDSYVWRAILYKERAVTTSFSGELWLWNSDTGEVLRRLEETGGLTDWTSIKIMALCPDNASVVTGHSNGYVRRWELESGKLLEETKIGDESIETLLRRPNTDELIVYPRDQNVVYVFQEYNLADPVRTFIHDQDLFNAVKLSQDGSLMVTKSSKGEEHVWQLDTGKLMARGYFDFESGLPGAITNDGSTLISGSEHGSILLSEVPNMHAPVAWFRPLKEYETASLSPNSQAMISLSEKTIRISNRENSFPTNDDSYHDFKIENLPDKIVWSPDGKDVVLLERDNLTICSFRDQQWQDFPIQTGDLEHESRFNILNPKKVQWWNKEGSNTLLIQTNANELLVAATARAEEAPINLLKKDLDSFAIASNGKVAWRIGSDIYLGNSFSEHQWRQTGFQDAGLLWSSDGRFLLATMLTGEFTCLDPETGKSLWSGFGNDFEVETAVVSGDGKHMLTIDETGAAVAHEISRQRLVGKLASKSSPFVDAVFDQTGTRLLLTLAKGGIELVEIQGDKLQQVTLRYDQENIARGHSSVSQSTKSIFQATVDGSLFEFKFKSPSQESNQ